MPLAPVGPSPNPHGACCQISYLHVIFGGAVSWSDLAMQSHRWGLRAKNYAHANVAPRQDAWSCCYLDQLPGLLSITFFNFFKGAISGISGISTGKNPSCLFYKTFFFNSNVKKKKYHEANAEVEVSLHRSNLVEVLSKDSLVPGDELWWKNRNAFQPELKFSTTKIPWSCWLFSEVFSLC